MVLQYMFPVLGKLAEYTVAPVGRQFGYLINYEKNVEHLNQKMDSLATRRDGVLLATDAAARNLETILPEVKEWLEHVNETIADKETSFENETLARRSNRWLPNWKIRYSLGRKAKKMAPSVDRLLDVKFDKVACPAPPPEIEFPPAQPFEDSSQLVTNSDEAASSSGTSNTTSPPGSGTHIEFESRKLIIRDVIEALKGNQINPIVINGMGGVGKTTLMGDVVNNAKAEDLFYEYTSAHVSETPDVSKIQGELAEYLGLSLTQLGGIKSRADKLRKRLSDTKRVLVILDNVWSHLDLWEVGIPCNLKSCTVLVTSRNQDIFNEMETRKIFHIKVLAEDEAWCLFKIVTGVSIESFDPELKMVAKKVLSECGGLPLAISTLGGQLRVDEKFIWEDALRRLTKASAEFRLGMDKKVYEPIKLSYDMLDGELKSCFMLCCLFPERSDILLQDLVIYGIGIGILLGIDSIKEGRNLVKALVERLKSCHLLLDIDKEEYIRMHDVVRDVGLYIASDPHEERFAVSHRIESNEDVVPEEYTSSALRTGNSSHRTQLSLLSCMSKYSVSEPPPTAMFERMKEIKVLDIKRTTALPILPSLLLFENLRALYLEYCDLRSEMVGAVIGKLGTLIILSFRGSRIRELPAEFKNLSDLRLLDLTECSELESIAPGVVSSFSQLEELLMWKSFENRDKTWLDELVSLRCLTNLQIALPPIDNLGNSLLFQNLGRFRISIGSMHEYMFKHATNNYLRLDDVDAVYLLGSGIIELLKRTAELHIKMRNLSCPLNLALHTGCWAKVRSLTLEDCYGLRYIIDTTLAAPSCVFPVLNSLKLKKVRWLERICQGELTLGSLQRLRKLTLLDLPMLKYVLKIESQSPILRQLELLYIENCQSLEEIFAYEE
ncbi:probable disease resistance protein At4g27220, partial [Argentina anserina]|uniref:probable disease resistance protein At4g27220 n=1 Tax=Argentina anserina TaxID=57926 RepID=UPI00217648F7